MRRMFFLFFAILSVGQAIAQGTASVPVDPDTHTIMYREVISQEGTRDILYDRSAEWFRTYYVNPTSVTRILDKVNGKIEGTGRFRIYSFLKDSTRIDAGMINYDIMLEMKDNKVRYTLNNFLLRAASKFPLEKWLNKKDPAYNPKWDIYLYQVDTTMRNLVKSLKEGMKPKVIKKDEW